jgi:hypothetical protein
MCKVMRWDNDDAINHNRLHMCDYIMANDDIINHGEVTSR